MLKLIFEGASRRVLRHEHEVYGSGFDFRMRDRLVSGPSPVRFADSHTGNGFLNGLQLGGSYDVTIEFSQVDIENWLSSIVADDPVAAVALFSKMQLRAAETLAALIPEAETEEDPLSLEEDEEGDEDDG